MGKMTEAVPLLHYLNNRPGNSISTGLIRPHQLPQLSCTSWRLAGWLPLVTDESLRSGVLASATVLCCLTFLTLFKWKHWWVWVCVCVTERERKKERGFIWRRVLMNIISITPVFVLFLSTSAVLLVSLMLHWWVPDSQPQLEVKRSYLHRAGACDS